MEEACCFISMHLENFSLQKPNDFDKDISLLNLKPHISLKKY